MPEQPPTDTAGLMPEPIEGTCEDMTRTGLPKDGSREAVATNTRSTPDGNNGSAGERAAFRFLVGVNFISSTPVPRMQYVHTLVPTAERLDRTNSLRRSIGYAPLTFNEFVERCATEEERNSAPTSVSTETKRTKAARRALRVVGLERFLFPPDPAEIEKETLKFESLAELENHLARRFAGSEVSSD